MTDVPPARSVRMIFEFSGDEVRLLEQHPVNATAGLSGAQFRDPQPGDYVEVRNRDGQAVSRVPVWTGIGSTVETFPQDPYIGPEAPRILTVVVPAPHDADHVAVVRDSRDPGRTAGTAGADVLGTFRLQP
jgi:hypothetical protein